METIPEEPLIGEERKADTVLPILENLCQSTAVSKKRKRSDSPEPAGIVTAAEGVEKGDPLVAEKDEEEKRNKKLCNQKYKLHSYYRGNGNETRDPYNGRVEFKRDMADIYADVEKNMDRETEVEKTKIFISDEETGDEEIDCRVFVEEYDFDEQPTNWMETIHVECSSDGELIGRGTGRYIKRDDIRANFWRDMEAPCLELSKIAFGLFDRYGQLKKEWMVHPVRKGTGVWGSELDSGSFFVIEEVVIDRGWRRSSIGMKIVNHLIRKSRQGGRQPKFSLVMPGWIEENLEPFSEEWSELEQQCGKLCTLEHAILFFRSLGFRRVGASDFFCLSADTEHPAHAILPEDDFDPAEDELNTDRTPENQNSDDYFSTGIRKSWRKEILKERYPLLYAATLLNDGKCVEVFKAWKTYDKPAEEWDRVDMLGNNVLHVAANAFKIQTIRWLLDESGEGQMLSSARNVQGFTPLEELEYNIEVHRTTRGRGNNLMTIVLSDTFIGFTRQAVNCLAVLRRLDHPSESQLARMKFGCTCGKCIDGFLSPRMQFALLREAEITHDVLNLSIEDGGEWLEMHDWLFMFTYVSPDMKLNFVLDESYRQGFTNIFLQAFTILETNRPPTISNLLDICTTDTDSLPNANHFLQAGGTPESVLKIIFDHARRQDEFAGDGNHKKEFADEIEAIVKCRNDHEFGFVALACGI